MGSLSALRSRYFFAWLIHHKKMSSTQLGLQAILRINIKNFRIYFEVLIYFITLYFKVLFMESKNYQDELAHIRQMMERSSRFISLSGLSGVIAGIVALLGSVYVYFIFQREGINYFDGQRNIYTPSLAKELFFVAIMVLILAISSGYIFTARKSKKQNLRVWDATTKRLLINFAIPLVAGGFFCLALWYHHYFPLIAPSMLIFYGLALINAERYTLSDVKYLGICEVILGIIALFWLGWGLIFWAIGFGFLHIFYGTMMYRKYD